MNSTMHEQIVSAIEANDKKKIASIVWILKTRKMLNSQECFLFFKNAYVDLTREKYDSFFSD